MKTIQINCDGCNYDLSNDRSSGVYLLSHISMFGEAIMGDNRIIREKHYCKNCFSKIYSNLPTKA